MGLSVDDDGNIIVADINNKMIKVFSSDDMFLMKIGGQGAFTCPIHYVQYDTYLIVSDQLNIVLKFMTGVETFSTSSERRVEGTGSSIIRNVCL